jgi:hypothetical protein
MVSLLQQLLLKIMTDLNLPKNYQYGGQIKLCYKIMKSKSKLPTVVWKGYRLFFHNKKWLLYSNHRLYEPKDKELIDELNRLYNEQNS